MEQAGRTGVGCRRHHLSQGLDPGRPGRETTNRKPHLAPRPVSPASAPPLLKPNR